MAARCFAKLSLFGILAAMMLLCPQLCFAQSVTESLPQEISQYLVSERPFDDLWQQLLETVKTNAELPMRQLLLCVGFSLLGAFAVCLLGTDSATAKAVLLCVRCAAWLGLAKTVLPLLSSRSTVASAATTMGAFMPVAAGLLSAGGGVNSAAKMSLLCSSLCAVVSTVVVKAVDTVVPFALGISAASLFCEDTLGRICSGICAAFSKVLVAASGAFLAFVRLQSAVASAADSAALRAGQVALHIAVPVLGGTISGSASAVAASLGVIRTAVGTAGICAVGAALLPTSVKLALCCAALWVGELCCGALGGGLNHLIKAVRNAVQLLAAVHALCAVLFIFMISNMLLGTGMAVV